MEGKKENPRPSLKRIFVWSAIVIVVVVMGSCVSYGYYSNSLFERGFCAKDDRLVTDEERIRRIVDTVVYGHSSSKGLVRERTGRPIEPVPYTSLHEFFDSNPGCCEMKSHLDTSEGSYRPEPVEYPWWGVVKITYALRYREQSGKEGHVMVTYETPVNACGEAIRPW